MRLLGITHADVKSLTGHDVLALMKEMMRHDFFFPPEVAKKRVTLKQAALKLQEQPATAAASSSSQMFQNTLKIAEFDWDSITIQRDFGGDES